MTIREAMLADKEWPQQHHVDSMKNRLASLKADRDAYGRDHLLCFLVRQIDSDIFWQESAIMRAKGLRPDLTY